MVEWRREYEIGVETVDEQHRRLFGAADELLVAIGARRHEAIAPTLAFLRRYALEHFRTEQALMSASGYPRADEHASEHGRFLAELVELEAQHARDPKSPWTASKLGVGLASWLRHHVLGRDAELGRHLRSQPPARW